MTSVPADFSTYIMRAKLMAKQRAAQEPLRSQLGILIGQCFTLDRDPAVRSEVLAAMKKQVGVIEGTTRIHPFAI